MAITNIYKGALERSDIDKIYKGTTLLYEKVLPPQGETWLINEYLYPPGSFSYNINFTSNNENFTQISKTWDNKESVLTLKYGNQVVWASASGSWVNENYRTITFETAPTGDLLTWLGSNAVEQ